MTICKLTDLACDCQPDEGVPCSAEGDGLKRMMLSWRDEAMRLQALVPNKACDCPVGLRALDSNGMMLLSRDEHGSCRTIVLYDGLTDRRQKFVNEECQGWHEYREHVCDDEVFVNTERCSSFFSAHLEMLWSGVI